VFSPEIDAFKREYRLSYPDKSVDALTDGDLLREVVNTVGRPGKLGEHIRCVVSVGMLTEGWDANTVTHIVGVRAFGSQLLCEQVAGRALRRRQYFLDPKTGKFPPEYAHIIGVPFKFFKGGETTAPTPQDIQQLLAMPERAELAIEFPNLLGYKINHDLEGVRADFASTPMHVLNLHERPTQTTMGSAFSSEEQELITDVDSMRDQEVVYWIAKEVMSRYYRDDQGRPQLEKFTDIRRIAQQWFDRKIELVGETDVRYKRLIRVEDPKSVARAVYLGVEAAALQKQLDTGAERAPQILPLLNHYNPRSSSAYVHGATTKPVYPTKKSHVNFVVADTDSWEQIAAKTFEKMPAVQSYVKNAFLGFAIPYVDKQGTERQYQPDFLCRVKTPEGELFNLIVEITGFAKDKELKRYFTTQRWLPAVNAQRAQLGLAGGLPWYFCEITDIERIKNTLAEEIERVSIEVDASAERHFWMAASSVSLRQIWDNADDEIWNDQ
jgi:type III restriction enzyme